MKLILSLVFIPCLVCMFFFGKYFGNCNEQQHYAAAELRLIVSNLENSSGVISPQLREFLKGRLYVLLIKGVRSDWVQSSVDYGPIDREILGPIKIVKGGTSDEDLYRLAMKKSN